MKYFLLLLCIVLIAASVRFYQLGIVPQGLHRDEAFLGYNAYSILKTGKDMSGNFLPLHLESFLYSPAGYSYFSIPFIQLFDLSVFSVRFASAFFGTLTVVIVYFLARQLFLEHKNRNVIAIASCFLLAITPWHISLSRTATENTLVVFFISLGVLLYVLWIRKPKILYMLLSFVCFTITLFIYQAPRAFLPFFIPLLIAGSFHVYKKRNKLIVMSVLYVVFIIIPIFFILLDKNLTLRIRTLNIFSTQSEQLVLDEQIRNDGISGVPIIVTRMLHNKPAGYFDIFLKNYFKHFSFDFLFTDQGYPDRYRVPLMSILYIFDLPFLILGTWYLLSKDKKNAVFLLGWILLVPIGSALTFDDIPNVQRTLLFFPALSIVSALGFVYLSSLFDKNTLVKKSFITVFMLVVIFNLSVYLHQYYIHFPLYRPWFRQDGYKELVSFVNSNLSRFDKAIITNRESAPTIFFLFYTKYDPYKFQAETKHSALRDFDRVGFYKYEFSQEECPLTKPPDQKKEPFSKHVLYVNSGLCKIPESAKVLDTIRRKDNSVVFYLLAI